MANDRAFKVKNGLQAVRYLQSAGTETAGSEAYSLASASYDGVSLTVSSQDTTAWGLFFKPDGAKVFLLGKTNDTIYQYGLSTAWDLSTASYDSVSLSVTTQEDQPNSIFFKDDGTRLYVAGTGGDDINQYNLSTAWDLTTASYSQNFSLVSQTNNPSGIFFKSDGTKLYMVSDQLNNVYQYSLSTAWDISTLSYDSVTFNVGSQMANARNLFFKADGSKMYVVGNTAIYQYGLSTAWDLSTASYDSISHTVLEDTFPTDVFFKPDGNKMYVTGSTGDKIYQYTPILSTQTLDLSTGTYFSFTPSGATEVSFTNPPASGLAIGFAVEINGDGSAITWPSSVKWHEAAAPTATASKEVYVFVTTDGGVTYYGKQSGSDIA